MLLDYGDRPLSASAPARLRRLRTRLHTRSRIDELATSYDAIHVIRPTCSERFFSGGYLWPSSCATWGGGAAESMVKFVLIDMSADTLPLRISSSAHDDNYIPRANTVVVDMEKGARIYDGRR